MNNINNEEVRQLQGEIRAIDNTTNTESRTIEGYALLFNSKSQYLFAPETRRFFYEIIDTKALDNVLVNSDVFALFNHEKTQVLARYCNGIGSLNLEIDDKGLKYSFEAPKTELGNEVLEGVKRLDIRNSSFAFSVADEIWDVDEDGNDIRTILKFDKIFDVSPVYQPAYQDTTVAARSLDNIKNNKEIELKKYYDELNHKINKIKNNK